MRRKILLGLVIALMVSLSACGGNKGTGSEGKENVSQSENSTGGDSDTTGKDEDKETKKDSKKKEVSLENLENMEVSPAEDFEFIIDGKNPDGLSLCGYNGNDEMVVIPDEVDGKKVVSIISKAFGEDSGVKAVKISDTVERVGKMAFFGNEDLQYVIFGNNVKEIGLCAFQGCDSLERVELNEGVEKIESNAFTDMDKLTYLYAPASVTEIITTAIYIGNEDFVLAGKSGSYAEEYAKELNYTFEAVE